MRKQILTIGLLSTAFFIASCGGDANDSESANVETSEVKEEERKFPSDARTSKGITLYKADIAKEFPDAKLTLESPKPDDINAAGNYTFKYNVEDYELATQTPGAEDRHCANSQEGQHIHFIVNNGPYSAHYEPSFSADLGEGNNIVLSFLSRSYHESIKNGSAYTLENYIIGDVKDKFDNKAEHLFYSRPKGTYSGKDTKKILLDFYLINSELSADGNKVQATINGATFLLDEWAPYFVEGLKEGENTFRIQLINNDGDVVPGPFNDSGERVITLENVPNNNAASNTGMEH